jgi:hypothetical protein
MCMESWAGDGGARVAVSSNLVWSSSGGIREGSAGRGPSASGESRRAGTAPARARVRAVELGRAVGRVGYEVHLILLRHQEGDDWDYVQIEHLGTKATVDIPSAPPAAARNLSAWHDDTFAAGPPWADFARALGVGGNASSSASFVYVVSAFRAVPGHREQLQQVLTRNDPSAKIQVGNVLLHSLDSPGGMLLRVSFGRRSTSTG